MNRWLCLLFFSYLSILSAIAQSAEFPASMASKSLPVVYIDTEHSRPIVDKVTKIPASFEIDNYQGSRTDHVDNQVFPAITIAGRGNVSWKHEKKPYKIKFEHNTELLGMPANKSFALIPQQGYCDILAIMMERRAAEMLNLGWTPHGEPVELVLNDSYEGIYLLTEKVDIHPNRLNIYKQPDLNTDSELISGGWLLEIDNYDDPSQIVIDECEGKKIRFTYHNPDELSDMQVKWLTDEMTRVNAAIYSNDSTGQTWGELIDSDSAVKYFLTRELFHDYDGYNGSFYIYKDFGYDSKWHFGPLWDPIFGKHKTDWIMNEHPENADVHWIEPMFATALFREKAAEAWEEFEPMLPELYNYGLALSEEISDAMIANNKRWPKQEANAFTEFTYVHGGLMHNSSWIGNKLRELTDKPSDSLPDSTPEYYTVQGFKVAEEDLRPGQLYICKGANGSRKIIRQ